MENINESPISFIYFDKSPEMKLISYVEIKSEQVLDSFIEEFCGVDDAA